MIHHTHNDFHLGDNLVVLNFLRRLALRHPGHEFVHAAHLCYLPQLEAVVADVPGLRLIQIEQRDPRSMDLWKNAGAGTSTGGFWEKHALKLDFAWFHVAWFTAVSERMGLESPIHRPWDLLFDYPALLTPVPGEDEQAGDILVVNSRPCSGQCLAYERVEYFDGLLADLVARGHRVVCTQKTDVPGVICTADHDLTVTQIGRLSMRCKYIVGVATGPLWPTFNVWNQTKVEARIILLSGEDLNLGTNCVQVPNIERAREMLSERKVI